MLVTKKAFQAEQLAQDKRYAQRLEEEKHLRTLIDLQRGCIERQQKEIEDLEFRLNNLVDACSRVPYYPGVSVQEALTFVLKHLNVHLNEPPQEKLYVSAWPKKEHWEK